MARSKAYLSRAAEIRWECDPKLLKDDDKTPARAILHYPNGLADMMKVEAEGATLVLPDAFTGRVDLEGGGAVEWAIVWSANGFGEADGFTRSYCNTIPTPEGGTHEAGMRSALTKGLRAYGDMVGNRKTGMITADDVLGTAGALLSVFIRNPEFVGQTKEKLSTQDAFRITENAMRDRFDHWLTASTANANRLLE
jgi:topoisomerase-4 subunit B